MHKGVILLVKATDKESAILQVDEFMKPYYGEVYDWYVIGGRCSGCLIKNDEFDAFAKNLIEAEKKLDEKYHNLPKNFLPQSLIQANKDKFQNKWEELKMKGSNPFANHYELPRTGGEYDIMPLTECAEIVKTWIKDLDKEADEIWNNLVNARNENKTTSGMSGYYASEYSDAIYRNFCFNSNVYNISEDEAETMPEESDFNNYMAVIIDMHN